MKVVIASSEVVPFAKTGGLADVAGALPKEIKKLKNEVIVAMPAYKAVDRKKYRVTECGSFDVPVADRMEKASVLVSKLPGSAVPVYLIDNPRYFDRSGLYQEKGSDYPDNDERFVFFDRAVIELCKYLGIKPDVIHCNDWQTGLIPVYLKTIYAHDPFFTGTATLFTIHNLAYQGLFDPARVIQLSNLPWDVFTPDKLEFWGKISFIKGGLVYSDIINTVSEKYSEEIQTEEYGCGLQGLLAARQADLYGVVNGVDYAVWNPQTDTLIADKYSASRLEGKEVNKKALLKAYGLKVRKNAPVIGVISRLADQKGFDLIAEIIDELMQKNIMLVLLGTGDEKYHKLFADIQKKYPTKAGIALKYDAELAQLIYAGSDMFLMPSHYEPCGLGQLISLKYGTIPIVRETGGLADTIIDFEMTDVFEADKANGFVFSGYDARNMFEKMCKALDVYKNKNAWTKLVRNAMKYDYSWKKSAKKYIELYNKAIAKR